VRKRFIWGGDWHGTPYAGKAPRDIGIIYKEIVAAQKKGDNKTASRKLGWLAHLIGDLSMPMHIVGYSRYIPLSRQHTMHVAAESDLDYYQRYTVGRHRNKWPTDVEKVIKNYLPGAASITTSSTPQAVRLQWFGGKVTTPSRPGKSARALALSTASKVKSTYGKAFWQNWAKGWKKGYKTKQADGSHPSRGTATKYLVSKAPGMLKVSSTNLATLIVALSSSKTRASGIDQIRTPSTRLKAPARARISKKSRVAKLIRAARGAKRTKLKKKYLAAPKRLNYQVAVTVKTRAGKAISTLPLAVKWKNAKGKTLKSATVWTNSKGKSTLRYSLATPKKKSTYSVEITAPTSDLKSAKKLSFKVDPKKYTKKLR
jgi:hypothetical protein